jgi:hypothetical protein
MSNKVSKQTLILRHIRDNKKVLLEKAFVAILGLPMMVYLFRECYEISKNREAKDIFNWVCITFSKEIEKQGRGISLPIDKNRLTEDQYSQMMAKIQIIADGMLQANYKPPGDDDELSMHLWAMYRLYENIPISWPHAIEDISLDFSFAKLLARANLRIGSEFTHAERKEIASRGSTATKIEKAKKWKSYVLAIYEHGEPIAPKTKLSEAFETIRRQFDESKESALKQSGRAEPKWGVIPDSVKMGKRDTLKALFKTEGILERDFEKLGHYWLKKM